MRMMNKLIAFTLTELLLAIAIVGVIAALVLPASVSKFNDKLIDNAHDRNLQSITTAIQNLAVTENKSSFNSTMMYVNASEDIVEGDYANTSGKFLKKYLRVSKYCGNSNGDCFAKKYYEYPEGSHVKREYTPTYKGGCAILKSGASLCLEPQVGSANIKGLIDINGPKGPNVWERDLREIDIPAINALSRNNATETVITTAGETFELEETNVCDTNPDSLACCQTLDSSTITAGHACCAHSEISSVVSACTVPVEVTLVVDLHCEYSTSGPCSSGSKCTWCQLYATVWEGDSFGVDVSSLISVDLETAGYGGNYSVRGTLSPTEVAYTNNFANGLVRTTYKSPAFTHNMLHHSSSSGNNTYPSYAIVKINGEEVKKFSIATTSQSTYYKSWNNEFKYTVE